MHIKLMKKININHIYLLCFYFNDKESKSKIVYGVISYNDQHKSIQTIYKNLNDAINKLCIEVEDKW